MYVFMITCYILMVINCFNLLLCGAMGFLGFNTFSANHAQFSLFSILIFILTETLVMYFFIATGKSIKTILSEQNHSKSGKIWEKIKSIKKIIFPQIMLTILLVGGTYIFYFGYIKSSTINDGAPLSWVQVPLYCIAIAHHVWSLKIKNDSFKMQIDLVNEMSTYTE